MARKKRLPKPVPWMPPSTSVVHVEVTEADIAFGRGEDGLSCPVAHALERAAGLIAAQVLPGGYRVVGLTFNWKLPVSVWPWVRRFDAGKPVEPFAFDWWAVN